LELRFYFTVFFLFYRYSGRYVTPFQVWYLLPELAVWYVRHAREIHLTGREGRDPPEVDVTGS